MTIEQIKEANKRAGFHFFEVATLRFFKSRIGEQVYQGPGGTYFVTSEQFVPSSGIPEARGYTVRLFNLETHDISTVGRFNVLTKHVAHSKAYRAALVAKD